MSQPTSMERGRRLARWARDSIRQALGGPVAERPTGARYEEPGATFVSLHWKESGELQGCIGSLEAQRPLADDVAFNAVAAALRDPRSRPCDLGDLDRLDIELSLLSPLEELSSQEEIRVGVDGVVLARGGRRATFLPVVWKSLPTLDEFLHELKRKAGLSPEDGPVRLWRYSVETYEDHAP